jgi:S1-C subfamily serine protease
MLKLSGSHVASAVVGGLVVAGGVLALGLTGRSTMTETVLQEAPVAAASSAVAGLTANEIYQRNAPGVVFIRARLADHVESPFDAGHRPQRGYSTGSGFLADRRGDILTDYHVIAGARRTGGLTVELEGGVQRVARVAGADPAADLAVLKVDLDGAPAVRPLALGDSTTVSVGDPTLAIGNPFGVDRTLSSGIVSALAHQIRASDGHSVDNVIQTDGPLDPGGAGGPLLDAAGRVIGINSQIISSAGAGLAVSFATPINTATPMLRRVQLGAG